MSGTKQSLKNIIIYWFVLKIAYLLKIIGWPRIILNISNSAKKVLETNNKIIFSSDHSNIIMFIVYLLLTDENDLLIPLSKACTMTSTSKDGSLIKKYLDQNGVCCIERKSLQKGKSVFRDRYRSYMNLLNEFVCNAINEKNKNNNSSYSHSVVLASIQSDTLILPVVCSSRFEIRINKNWDLMKIPLGRIYINIGDPLAVNAEEWATNKETCKNKFLHSFKQLETNNLQKIREK